MKKFFKFICNFKKTLIYQQIRKAATFLVAAFLSFFMLVVCKSEEIDYG